MPKGGEVDQNADQAEDKVEEQYPGEYFARFHTLPEKASHGHGKEKYHHQVEDGEGVAADLYPGIQVCDEEGGKNKDEGEQYILLFRFEHP
jgi:hypothetical protein